MSQNRPPLPLFANGIGVSDLGGVGAGVVSGVGEGVVGSDVHDSTMSAAMALVMASVKSVTVSSETALAGFGDSVGDFGDGVVGDGVRDVGDVVVGDGVGEVGVGNLVDTFRWHFCR